MQYNLAVCLSLSNQRIKGFCIDLGKKFIPAATSGTNYIWILHIFGKLVLPINTMWMFLISQALDFKRKNKNFKSTQAPCSVNLLCFSPLLFLIDIINLKLFRSELWSANTIKHWLKPRLVPSGKLPHVKVLVVSFYFSLSALKSLVLKSNDTLGQLGGMMGKKTKMSVLFSWHILATNKFPTTEEQMSDFRRNWAAKALCKGLFESEKNETDVKTASEIKNVREI